MADLQHPRWEKPGKLWSLPLRDVAVLDAFQLRWAIRIIRIPVKDIEFFSCHFVIPWACKLIEHLRASSCCTVVSFALPPVPFASPTRASITPISARYIRQFLSSLSWFPITPRRHNPWCFYTTPMWDVMWNIPYFLHVLLSFALQPFPLAYPRAYRELQSGRVMSANSSTPALASPSPRGGIPPCDSCPAGVLRTPAPPSPTPLKLVPENTCPAWEHLPHLSPTPQPPTNHPPKNGPGGNRYPHGTWGENCSPAQILPQPFQGFGPVLPRPPQTPNSRFARKKQLRHAYRLAFVIIEIFYICLGSTLV